MRAIDESHTRATSLRVILKSQTTSRTATVVPEIKESQGLPTMVQAIYEFPARAIGLRVILESAKKTDPVG